MRFSKAVVKNRVLILIAAFLLLVPASIGMATQRINFDMLTYLPGEIDTMIGQDVLMDEFGKGAFSLVVVEGMPDADAARLRDELEAVEHVDSVLWRCSLTVPPRRTRPRRRSGRCAPCAENSAFCRA